MANTQLSRRKFLVQAPIAGSGVALAGSAQASPTTVSPEMYATIEAHKTAVASHHVIYEEVFPEDKPFSTVVNDNDRQRQEAALDWVHDSFEAICAQRPTYPGDNAARAKYLLEYSFGDLENREVVALLNSLI